jgi:DNA-binding NtrC family response regulator
MQGTMQQPNARSIVLVVEDEPLIRTVLIDAFEEAGFTVLDASDGDHAVQMLEQNANRVCALFSDINLPGSMNGVLLAKHARNHWPWIGVVLASGRPKPDKSAMPENVEFFQKPYAISSIIQHVRELVD